MKKIVLFGLLALALGFLGTGCIPPPPHQSPKLPPAPPGGPSAVVRWDGFGAIAAVVVPHNFGNLPG